MVKLLVKHGIIICESYMQYTDNGRKLISVIESLKQSGQDEIAAYLENEHNRRYEVLQKELNVECNSKANESTSLTSCRS